MNNVLVLTYWSYQNALIQTYTLPYVRLIKSNLPAGSKIYLFTIEQSNFKMSDKQWLEEKNNLDKEGIVLIRLTYAHFGIKMIGRLISTYFKLKKLIKIEKVSTIHAWCTPAAALGYFLSRATNRPLIIDSYEPHAESMVENGTWSRSGLKFKLLFWLEKKQSRKANTVIALTEGMKKYAKKKYNATFKNYHVKPAMVDLNKFKWDIETYHLLREKNNLNDKLICLYAGKLGGIYLEEEVFDFFKTAYNYWGDKLKIFLLTDKSKSEVTQLVNSKSIPESCIETKFVAFEKIHEYFQLADFAINPVKPVPSKRYCTSIKDGEYWAAGLPVIITKGISDDSDIIDENNIGYVLKELSENEYKLACNKIDSLVKNDKKELRNTIMSIAEKYRNFKVAEEIYKNIYL